MFNWLALIASLLPVVAKVVDEVHSDLAAHQKQLIVTHVLQGAAAGAAAVAPQYATAATDAAAGAGATVAAVTAIVTDAKKGDVANAVTSGVVAAVTGISSAAQVEMDLTPQPGPGLDKVVPQ
jgi:hypothetical protein